jgi:hypothetical protein
MKKSLSLLSIILLLIGKLSAQITVLPYSEGFEDSFQTGLNVQFLPSWTGNEVNTTNRIHQEATFPRSGSLDMAITPTSSFIAVATLDLDLTAYKNVFTEFYCATRKNGSTSDNRPALFFASVSLDGGLTYSTETMIGDSTVFENNNTNYNRYQYVLPPAANFNPNVVLKLRVKRGVGAGTAAKLLMDDLMVISSTIDSFAPLANEAYIIDANHINVVFNEPMGLSAENIANYTGLPTIQSALRTPSLDTVQITLTNPLTIGQNYIMVVSNAQDTSGNDMVPEDFTLTYNPQSEGLVISEILYNNPSNDIIEFIEFYNASCSALPLGGYYVEEAITATLPNVTLQPGEYLVMTMDSVEFLNRTGVTAYQWQGGFLNNSGDSIIVKNTLGIIVDSVNYSNNAPWPTAADGNGPSLVVCNALVDNGDPLNWGVSTEFICTVPVSTGSDSVFATPGSKCSSAANPVINLGPDMGVCSNSSMVLDAGNPGSVYLWSTGETTQSIIASGFGTYWVLVNNGSSVSSDTVEFTDASVTAICNVPDTIPSFNSTFIYQFNNTSVTSCGTVQYFWDFAFTTSADTSPIITFQVPGMYSYTLIATNSCGCSDTLTDSIYFDLTTGIENALSLSSVVIYPNPTSKEFKVDGIGFGSLEIVLLSISGMEVYKENKEVSGKFSLPINSNATLPKGLYFLQVRNQDKLFTKKLVVE